MRNPLALTVGFLTIAIAFGQTTGPAASQTKRAAKAVPRTMDGHPELQGIWTNATLTPSKGRPNSLEKSR
jgi:hypothetical protein